MRPSASLGLLRRKDSCSISIEREDSEVESARSVSREMKPKFMKSIREPGLMLRKPIMMNKPHFIKIEPKTLAEEISSSRTCSINLNFSKRRASLGDGFKKASSIKYHTQSNNLAVFSSGVPKELSDYNSQTHHHVQKRKQTFHANLNQDKTCQESKASKITHNDTKTHEDNTKQPQVSIHCDPEQNKRVSISYFLNQPTKEHKALQFELQLKRSSDPLKPILKHMKFSKSLLKGDKPAQFQFAKKNVTFSRNVLVCLFKNQSPYTEGN